MAAVVYLDADDEITSAASRIRVADDKRIALVVPYGSRLATSRINFRLLAREAQARGHRLSVVAGDAATRALAASAGLPVFGSVNEYEEAETTRPTAEAAAAAAAAGAATVAGDRPGRGRGSRAGRNGADPADAGAAGAAAAAGLGAAVAADGAPAAAGKRTTPPPPDLDATQPVAVADTASVSGGRGTGGRNPTLATAAAGAAVGGGTVAAPAPRTFRVGKREVAWRWGQTGAIIVAALIGLGLLALAVGAFVLLPSAQAVVTLRHERIGPVQMEIVADPGATAVDAEAGVIPAQRLTFDVAASGTFPATGTRVVETRARGEVTFLSKNPVDENNIGAGAIVSTPNGIRFKTSRRITIPKATIVGLTVIPGEASVSIEAVEPGPEGNVGAQAITVIPGNEDPTFTEVRNPSPTTGGTREEFPLVQQSDIDAAMAELHTQLDEEFGRILADPGRIPPGLTAFGESRQLGDPLPTTDLATLVGQEGEDFTLGLATTGSVTAVDARPVESVAAERIRGDVGSGRRLVDGSVAVTPGEPTVDGEVVRFPVSATAAQIRVVDPAALREDIKGKPLDEARSILGQYGDVRLGVWPDWVSAIPTIDGRLDLRVDLPPGIDQPVGLPSASTAPSNAAPSPSGSAPGGPSTPSASQSAPPSAAGSSGLAGESPSP